MATPKTPASTTPAKSLTLTPDDEKLLTPAAAKLTYEDLQSIEKAFKNQDDRLKAMPQADLGCCCCCCTASAVTRF